MSTSVLAALLLSTLAGLSTGIGSLVAHVVKRPRLTTLSFFLGLSAGVMLYVSFVELLPEGSATIGEGWGLLVFLVGMAFAGGIDAVLPEVRSPHHVSDALGTACADADSSPISTKAVKSTNGASVAVPVEVERDRRHRHRGNQRSGNPGYGGPRGWGGGRVKRGKVPSWVKAGFPLANEATERELDTPPDREAILRTGMLTAVTIAVHNFPEGVATFSTALGNTTLGLAVCLAVAIHNVPEGISLSIPVYFATGDARKAFTYSMLSGLAEPAGALLAYALLLPFLSEGVLGGLLAFVAGIMVYVSVDELIPVAHGCGEGHHVLLGFALGTAIMAISLMLL
ncbi:MAG: hypothetical protein Kow0069_11880 [Promethearchaeota archaeon]